MTDTATIEIIREMLPAFIDIAIVGISIPIILKIVNLCLEQLQDYLSERKKENLWKKTIFRNKNVTDSFYDYREAVHSDKRWLIYLYCGSFLAFVTSFILLFISLYLESKIPNESSITSMNNFTNTSMITTYNPNLLPFISYPIMTFFVLLIVQLVSESIHKRSKSFKEETLLEKYNSTINKYWLIGSFMTLLLIAVVFNFAIFNLAPLPDNIYSSLVYFVFIILIYIHIFKYMILSIKDYKYEMKSYLNMKYGAGYPFVFISTIYNNKISGQVRGIFNQKYLGLNNDETEEIVLWSSIDTLTIQKQNTNQK